MGGKLRNFTVTEANALLPQIARLVERQSECVAEIERAVLAWRQIGGEAAALVAAGRAMPDLRPDAADGFAVVAIKSALREWIDVLRATWSAIESTGAVLKDSRAGLVHFRGENGHEHGWLCWKRGEPEVSFFHDQDDCPASRGPSSDAATPGSTPASVLN